MEDYDLLGKIGEGSQGTVFRVLHRPTHQEFAMKVIMCRDQDQVNFALKEIKVLLQLRNPHIVSYVDFYLQFSEPSQVAARCAASATSPSVSVCLVMELCHHENMEDRILSSKRHFMETGFHNLQDADIIKWMSQAAEALKYIHERGFLHRDLKPRNIFFSRHGNVKLGDFGLATAAGNGKESTVGTPHYFSPELLLRQAYNNKVDVWGLGVVFLELLTLRERPINTQVIQNPLAVESVMDDIKSMGFSCVIGLLVRDMLSRDPEGRPSPAAIIQRLSRNNAAQPLQIPIPAPSPAPPSVLCHMCEVDPSEVACAQCQQSFCKQCDVTRHKHVNRQLHKRERVHCGIFSTSQSSTNFEIVVPSSSAQNFTDAVRLAVSTSSKSLLRKIVLMPGLHSINEFMEVEFEGGITIEIVGKDPQPTLLFCGGDCGFALKSTSGKLSNISFSVAPSTKALRQGHPSCLELRSGNWSFEACNFENRGGCGAIASGNSTCANFTHCSFRNIKQAGLMFSNSSRGCVEECTFSNCEYAAILTKKNSNPIVRSCSITDGSETGLYCHDSSPQIETCTIERNGGCGIVVKGRQAKPVITRNTIIGSGQGGVFCSDGASPSLQFNTIAESRKAGVIVKTESCPEASGNTIVNNGEGGVFVFEGGKGIFSDNDISANSNAGVLVMSLASPSFVRNKILKNSYEGVWVCKAGSGVFRDNDVRGNAKGPRDVEVGCAIQWISNIEDSFLR